MKKSTLAVVVLAALSSPVAIADSGFFVSAGGANVSPVTSSGNLPTVETLANLSAGSTAVDVDSNTQLGLTLGYKFDDNWALELLAAAPFSHTANATVDGDHLVKVGDTKHLPPTLTIQYQFGDKNAAFRPFVGAGINYTWFFDTDVSPELVNTLESLSGLGFTMDNTELALSNSTGLAFQAGFDYAIDQNWSLRATYWKIDIETDAKVRLNGNDVEKVNIQIDPNVFYLGAKYSF